VADHPAWPGPAAGGIAAPFDHPWRILPTPALAGKVHDFELLRKVSRARLVLRSSEIEIGFLK
jgi:hypothetical protein